MQPLEVSAGICAPCLVNYVDPRLNLVAHCPLEVTAIIQLFNNLRVQIFYCINYFVHLWEGRF